MTPIDPAIEQEMDKAHLADYCNRLIKNDIGFLIAQSLSWSEYRFKLAIECLLEEAHAKAIEAIEDHYLTEDENIREAYFESGNTTLERMGKNLLFHLRQDIFIKLILVLIYANIKYPKNDEFKAVLLHLITRNRYTSRLRAILLSRHLPFEAFKGLNHFINRYCKTLKAKIEISNKDQQKIITEGYESLFSTKSEKMPHILEIIPHVHNEVIDRIRIESNLLDAVTMEGMNAIFFSALVDAYNGIPAEYFDLVARFGSKKQAAMPEKTCGTVISKIREILSKSKLDKYISVKGQKDLNWWLQVHNTIIIP